MKNMNMQENNISLLREEIEKAIGKALKTPKDFDSLSARIFDKLHENISSTTLKRFWGYIHDTQSKTSETTLDILARFVGYASWNDYHIHCVTEASVSQDTDIEQTQQTSPSKPFQSRRSLLWLAAIILLLLVGWGVMTYTSRHSVRMLHRGQTFARYEDYLQLFDLQSDDANYYWLHVPGHDKLMLWAPQYKHHIYHNEGDSAALLPTISVYYHPDDYPTDSLSLAQLAQFNKERYIKAFHDNLQCLVFMKNLVDTGFVFLGLYRLSSTLSDTTHVVYRRVLNDVEIDHLEKYKDLRL